MFPGFSNPVVPIETESSSENELDDTGSCPEVNRGRGHRPNISFGITYKFLGRDLASLWNGIIDDWGLWKWSPSGMASEGGGGGVRTRS